MSTDPYWFSDFATLELEKSGGTTDYAAGIKGATIEAEYQTLERLYTADSTQIEAQKQAEAHVPVELNYVKFDPEFAKEWLGGSGSSATSLTDTSDPQKYKLTGDFDNADGSTQINIEVTGITFPNIPLLDGSQDEFVEWSLSGSGENIPTFDTTQL